MAKKPLPVKFVEGTDDTLRILAAPYGGPFVGKSGEGSDLDGERFNKDTDFCLSWFPNDRPLLFDHGHDSEVAVDPVGRLDSKSIKRSDEGLWANAVLDRNDQYFSTIHELVEKGRLYASSGAMGHLVQVDKSGNIKRWPLVEVSLTPTPSNLLAQVGFENVVKHYKSAEMTLDVLDEANEVLKQVKAALEFGCACGYCRTELKAELSSDERKRISSADFAYVDSEGGKHLPIQDEAHVRNAVSRFGQTNFESDAKKRSAARKILARARKFSIDVADDSAVAKAAKSFYDLLALAKASEDQEFTDYAKTLMESVDTSGGFLVPEQHISEPVQKQATGDDDGGEDDAEEEDEEGGILQKKKKKISKSESETWFDKALDSLRETLAKSYQEHEAVEKMIHKEEDKWIVRSSDGSKVLGRYDSKAEAEERLREVEQHSDKSLRDGTYAFTKNDQLVLLTPVAVDEAKANDIVAAQSFHYGDPPEGSVEDWLCDLNDCLNKGMFGPFSYAGYADLIATFGYNGPGYAIVCLYTYSDDADAKFFRIDFDADENGEPVLKAATPYAAVYMPLDQVPSGVIPDEDDDDDAMEKSVVPLLMHGDFINKVAKVYRTRTKGVSDRRNKEGRVISTANRERIAQLIESVKGSLDDLQSLLDSTTPKAKADRTKLWHETEVVLLEASLLLEGAN